MPCANAYEKEQNSKEIGPKVNFNNRLPPLTIICVHSHRYIRQLNWTYCTQNEDVANAGVIRTRLQGNSNAAKIQILQISQHKAPK